MYLYVPKGYNSSVQWPFAIYFHGYGTGLPAIQGYHQGIYLNMTTDADAAGYVIAFGQGTPSSAGYLSWDAGRCCKGYNSTMVRVDDVTYTRTAIKMIESMVKIDPARRYVMGWSNGGMMTERLVWSDTSPSHHPPYPSSSSLPSLIFTLPFYCMAPLFVVCVAVL